MARPDHGLLLGLLDNDHPQYVLGVGGVGDHGGLDGLGDDDHPQYALLTYVDGLDHHPVYTDAEAVAAVLADDNYIKLAGDTATGTHNFGIITTTGDIAMNGSNLYSNGDWRIRRNGAADGDYYWLDNDNHRWYLNDVERMRMDANGDLRISGDQLYLGGGITGNDYIQISEASNYFRVVLDNAERFRVDTAGDIHFTGDQIFFDTIAGNDYIQLSESANYMRVVIDGTERFRVDNLGSITRTDPLAIDVYNSVAQGLSNGAWTNMAMNTERRDVGNDFNLSTDIWTCPIAGMYMFGVSARIDSIPSDYRIGVLHNTGASYEQWTNNVIGGYNTTWGMRYLDAGNTLRPRIYVNAASTNTLGNNSRFWVFRVA